MASPKMNVFKDLRDLVAKGMVNERMKEHLASADEMMKLDRSDPEAMRKYLAEKNAGVVGTLESHFGKGIVSPENQSHIEHIQSQALENSVAFHQMMKERQHAAKGPDGAMEEKKRGSGE